MSMDNRDNPNPYQAPMTASVTPIDASHVELAGRLNRFGAAMIDGIINFVLVIPVLFMTGYFERAMANAVSIGESVALTAAGMVAFLVIHGWFMANRGQTIGKALAKIKMVDYHTGQLLPLPKLIGLRYLPLWIIQSIPFVGILGIVDLLFIFGQERRCVHDYIAGTKVINC